MNKIEQTVLECYKRIMKSKGSIPNISINDKLKDENAIDSLDFVEFIVYIEEDLNIVLDSLLSEIRKCSTLKEIASVIEKANLIK